MMERISHRNACRPAPFWRAALAASTCLSAVVLGPALARAQSLPPGTTPTGGAVSAGTASIAQAPGQTTINQSSQNAAINWQTFNVGSAASVRFNQPNADATTLNRVIAASPSVIAGRIDANGNIIIINQSGVVFANGSQVDAHGVIATTSNVTDGNFMKNNLAFTGAPKPGAKIINDGHITVHDTGLVGLIAPQVANNGVITARLGQVVLAGATTFTLDLYGDRLISLDVTKAVRAVDVGGKPIAALVTNSGLILADGGKVTLTAQDADALVTQLINAGGTIRADTVGASTGNIALTGIGGDINIAGNLLARGKARGTSGGAIEAMTDGTVNVAPTARLNVAGAAGGGVIALGTDLARARAGASDTTAPRAAAVTVAAGAVIDASATAEGNAGTVTLLSADDTAFAGTIAVTGGPRGGNGGLAEISSNGVISLGGTVLDTAIGGQAGEVLLDPQTLVVESGNSGATTTTLNGTVTVGGFDSAQTTSYVDPASLAGLGGTIVLQAKSLLSVASAIDLTASSAALSLVSEGGVTVSAGITVNGSLEIDASTTLALTAGTLSAANILLSSGSGGTSIDMPVIATGDIALQSTGSVVEAAGGALSGATLISDGVIGGAALLTQPNSLAALGRFTATTSLAVNNPGALTLVGSLIAGDIFLTAGTLSDAGSPVAIIAGSSAAPGTLALAADDLAFGTGSTLDAPGGNIEFGPRSASVVDIGVSSSAGTLGLPTSLVARLGTDALGVLVGSASLGTLASAAAATVAIDGTENFQTALTLAASSLVSDNAGALTAGAVTLATGGFTQSAGAAIDTTLLTAIGTLSGLAAGGTANQVGTLGDINVAGTGTLSLIDTGLLTTGSLNAGAATLSAPTLAVDGAMSIAGALVLAGLTGGATQNAAITAGTLAGQGPLAGGISFTNTGNSIANIGNVTLTGTGALDVSDAGTLNLPGTITAPGGLSLAAGTLIAQPGTGAITAASTNELALLLAPTLSLAGTIGAPASGAEIALAADTLALAGTLNAGQGAVAIAPFTDNTTIVVGGGTAAGTLALDPALLGSITADALLLGSLDGVAARDTAGLILGAPLTVAGELGLFSTGEVLEQGTGALSALALVGAAGTVALGAAANSLGAVGAAPFTLAGVTLTGGLSATGALDLIDVTALNVAGPVTAGTSVALSAPTLSLSSTLSAPDVSLSATAGGLSLDGFVSAVTALVLASTADAAETGSLSVGTLSGDFGGALSLTGSNSIAALGAISLGTGSTFALDDLTALTIGGSLEAGEADFTAPGLDFTAPVSIAGAVILASLTTGLTQSAPLTAGTLTGEGALGGGITLTTTGNDIAALGNVSLTGGGLGLDDAGALELTGTIVDPGNLSLASTGAISQDVGGLISLSGAGAEASLSAPTLSLAGAVAASAHGAEIALQTDTLAVTGALSAPDGVVAIAPDSAGSTIAVGGASASGTLALASSVFANITADALLLGSLDGATAENTASIIVANAITAGALGLFSSGDINDAAGGTVVATALVGAAGGGFSLAQATNSVTALGAGPLVFAGQTLASGLTAQNGLTIVTATSLDVAGPIEADAGLGTGALSLSATALTVSGTLRGAGTTAIALSATAGGITVPGTIEATGLALASTGDVVETGAIDVDQLVAAGLGGALSLTGANSIGALGAVSLGADTLVIDDLTALTLAGALDAGAATMTATSLAIDAPVDIAGSLLLSSVSNGISATADISAATLTVQGATTNVILGGTDTIAILGGLDANTLVLTDSGPLTIAGALDLSGATISAGTLVQNAAVSVVNELLLANLAGGFAQSSPLTAGTLASDGTLGGTVALSNSGNDIGTLGALNVGGDLYLDDAQTVTLSSTVDVAGNVTFAGAGVSELSTGILSAGTVGTAGEITGSLLLGNDMFAPVGNTIAALGNATVAGFLDIDDVGNSLDIAQTDVATNIFVRASAIDGAGTLSASAFGTVGLLDVFAFVPDFSLHLRNSLGTIQMDNPSPAPTTLTAVSTANDLAGVVLVGGSNTTELTIAGTGALDYGSLSVELITTGSIADDSGTLTAAGLILDGTGFTQAPGALLDVGMLSSLGTVETAILLTNPGNSISQLGGLSLTSAGTLSVFDATALTIAAAIDPAFVTLSVAGALRIDADVDAGTAFVLAAGGDVIETGANIVAATLLSMGSIDGDVQLLASGNVIGSLGSFSATSLELAEAGSLGIAGPVSLVSGTLAVGTLGIPGTLTAGSLTLEGLAGGATESGALLLGTLSSAGSLTGAVALTGANSIAALGAFAADQLSLTDTGALDLAGSLTGGSMTFNAPTLGLNSALSLTGALVVGDLNADLMQTQAIDVGTFAADTALAVNVLLTNTANSIGTLGNLSLSTAGGTLAVSDAAALTLAGSIAAQIVDLAAGSITQSAGGLAAAALSVAASGAVALAGSQNAVAALDRLTGTSLVLNDTGSLDVTGSVNVGTASFNVPTLGLDSGVTVAGLLAFGSLNAGVTQTAAFAAATLASAGSASGVIALGNSANSIATLGDFTGGTLDLGDAEALAIAGSVNVGDLIFEAIGAGVTQSAGVIDAATLAVPGSLTGNVLLTQPGNTISSLAQATTGTLSLDDAQPLTIAGALSAAQATFTVTSLAVDAPVSITNALILSGLSGGLTETGGVTAATLAGVGDLTGLVALTGTNTIGSLGALNADDFALTDTGALTIAGALSGIDATLAAFSIAQVAPVSLTSSLTLGDLAGGYSQTAALSVPTLVSGGTLGGVPGSDVVLNDTANAIGTIGNFSLAGSLDLADAQTLDLAGSLRVSDLTLAGAGLTQSAGALTVQTLATNGTLSGDLLLGVTGSLVNSIAALGDIAVAGNVSIVATGGPLAVDGEVDAINLGIVSPTITGAGTLRASAPAAGGLGLLSLGFESLGGGLHLINEFDGAPGAIEIGASTLGPLVVLGDFSSLDTTGDFEVGNSLTTDITIAGNATFGSNNLSLFAQGTIYDDLGALSAASLSFTAADFTQAAGAAIDTGSIGSTGTPAGFILLGGSLNSFARLGSLALATDGTLSIDDATALTVAAPISADFVTLSAGALVLAADVTANNILALQSGGDIEAGAVAIDAPTLMSIGDIAGTASLGGGNLIGTLTQFSAASLRLDDAEPLLLAAAVSVTGLAALDLNSLDIAGSLSAGTLSLAGITSGVSETGTLAVQTLTGAGTLSGGVNLSGVNSIASLGAFAADTLSLDDSQALDIAGTLSGAAATLSAPSLTFAAPVSLTGALALAGITGGITQSSGAISVPTLSGIGPLAGTLALTGPGNDIGTLGAISLAAGTLALRDATALQLSDLLSDPTGLISLSALGIEETTGDIAAATLAISASGAVMLLGAANSIASLSSLSATTFDLADTGSLDITGQVVASTASLAVPTLGIDGAVSIGSLLTLGSLVTGVAENTGALSAGTLATDTGAAGTIILSNDTNAIGTLGDFSAATLAIADARPLDLAGNITLSLLALDNDAGNVEQSAGTLAAATLTAPGSLTGNITLGDAGDTIAVLGAATAQTLSLSQAGSLVIAGPVSLAAAMLNVASLAVTGSLAVAGALVLENLSNGLTATGAVSAGTVSGLGSLAGPIVFSNAGNSIAALGDITAASLSLLDAGGLDVTGTLDAPVLSLSSPTLGLGGDITAATLALGSDGGSITQTGGSLNVTTLLSAGTITGALLLQAGADSIDILGPMTLGGELALSDLAPFTIGASLVAGDIDFVAPSLSFATGQSSTIDGNAVLNAASGIALDGALTVAGLLDLESPGAIAQAATASLAAGTLGSNGAQDGAVTLAGAQNTFGTLAGFTAQSLLLVDQSGLTVAAALHVTSDATLADDAALAIDAPVTAGGTISLVSDAITFGTAGTIAAGSLIALTPPTPGTIDLGGTSPGLSLSAGLVAALTADTIVLSALSIVNDGAVSFGSNADLVAANAVLQTGPGTLGGAAISISAPRITLAGVIGATSTLGVTASGLIDLAGDAGAQSINLDAPVVTLTGMASAATSLTVTDSSAFAPSGTLLAADISLAAPALALSGLVSAANTLALDTTGALTDTGTLSAATLTFSAGNVVEDVGGLLTAALLTGTAGGGAVYLMNTANSIAALGPVTTAGDFDLADAAALAITAPVTASDINLVNTGGGVFLASGGSLVAGSGSLAIASDTLSASGGAGLMAASAILLSPATAGLPVDLGGTEAGALDLGAPLLAAANAPQLTIATAGSLLAEGAVGLGPVATLLLSAAGIGITGSLTVPGSVTAGATPATISLIELASTAPLTEAATGAITAATLATKGTLATDILLSSSLNSIGTLGNVALGAADSFALGDAGTLNLASTLVAGAANLAAGNLIVLGQAGTLQTAQALTLTAPSIALGGLVDAGALLAFDGATAVSEFTGASLSATTLAGYDPNLTIGLTGASNSFADLGALTAANLTFDDSRPLTITGALDLATATLSVSAVTLAGNADVAGLLLFPSLTGGLIQSGGTLTAGTLASGSADAGDIELGDAGNAIATLGVAAADELALVDAGRLTVAGPLTAPTATLSADTIALAGNLTDSSRLVLDDTGGGVAQTAGSLVIGTLASSIADVGPVSLIQPTNQIAALGAFTMATGSLALTTAGTLTLAGATTLASAVLRADSIVGVGALTGTAITLAASGIAFEAPLTATTALVLETSGDARETGAGAIITPVFGTGSGIGGNLDLGGANDIASLADVDLPNGTLTLNDVVGLSLDQLVTAASASFAASAIDVVGTLDVTGPASLTDNAPGGITLAGVASIGGLLRFGADGGVLNAGTLNAATIAGTFADGDATFGGVASVGTLAGLALGTNALALTDISDLLVAGPVDAASVSLAAAGLAVPGSISTSGALTLAAPSIGVTGVLDAVTTLAFESADTVAIPGAVAAATVTSDGTALGSVALTGRNTIAALADLSATGLLDIADSAALTLAGAVAAATATIAAPSLTLASDFAAGATLLLEGLQTGVLQTAGALSADSLLDSGANAGTISLLGPQNEIGTLGHLSLSQGDLLLTDAAPTLTIAGPLSVGVADLSAPNMRLLGPVNASALTLANAMSVGLNGDIDAGAILDLVNDGNVLQSDTASVTVATLNAAGTLGGNLDLPGANSIGALGTLFIPAGQLILADNIGLDLAGPLTVNNATITAASIDLTGTLLSAGNADLAATGAGGIILGGALGASSLLSLASAGGIEQTGALSAATLAGNADSAAFTGADSVVSLGAFTAANGFVLDDLASLAITGPVSVASAFISAASLTLSGSLAAAGAVTLAGANGIALAGGLDAGTTLALLSAGPLTGTGALAAATLTSDGQTDGAISLTDAQTTIGGLVSLGAASLDLVDQSALALAGIVAPVLIITAPSLRLTGDVTATLASVAAPGGLSQTAGSLTAGTLTSDGAANGNTTLDGNANAIGTLGVYSLAGGDEFSLVDGAGLTVAGPLTGAVIALSAASLTLTGTIDASTGLSLASPGDILQTGGLIIAPTLGSGPGGIGGDLALTAANSIAALGTLSDAGNIALVTVETLTFAEPVHAANVSLSAAGLDINAPFSTGILQISSTGPVNETGVLTVATLTTGPGSIAGALVLNAENDIADLGDFAATGGLVLNDASALTINGNVALGGALALNAAGIAQTAGAISATSLTSDGATIAGNAQLGQAGNAIPVLGNFAAAGNFTLADASPLALAGYISNNAGTMSLLGAAAVSQTAGIIATGLLNATGTAILLPDANVIAALGNVATAGLLSVNGADATTGQLSAGAVDITANGAFALGGTNTVTGAFDLSAAGALTQTNGSLRADTASLAAGAIILTGTDVIAGDLAVTTTGDITHSAGILDAGTLTGTAGQLASFAASTDFGTIGSFIMADSAFDLVNAGALSLVGPLVANTVSLSASGVLTLAGSVAGGLFITGAPAATTAVAPRAGVDSVLLGSSIQQLASFYINSGPGAALYNTQAALGAADQAATIFLLTVTSPTQAGGPIALSTSGLGLYAPNADLVLDGGTTGAMTGDVDVAHLEILGGLDAEFAGTIDGFTGQTAAGKADTFPVSLSRYQFNACPIGSVDCQILNIEAVPATNPLGNFDVTQRKRRRLDKNVQLPGIATHDF